MGLRGFVGQWGAHGLLKAMPRSRSAIVGDLRQDLPPTAHEVLGDLEADAGAVELLESGPDFLLQVQPGRCLVVGRGTTVTGSAPARALSRAACRVQGFSGVRVRVCSVSHEWP